MRGAVLIGLVAFSIAVPILSLCGFGASLGREIVKLDLLALIIAISAYLAAVRLAIIARLGADPKPRRPNDLKLFILSLIPADLNLIVAGSMLAVVMFTEAQGGKASPRLSNMVVPSFLFAVGYLVIHHLWGWIFSCWRYYWHPGYPYSDALLLKAVAQKSGGSLTISEGEIAGARTTELEKEWHGADLTIHVRHKDPAIPPPSKKVPKA
jgi:hypothetical protein